MEYHRQQEHSLVSPHPPTVADQALHEHNNVSYQQHIAIVDAIRRHDPDEADRALQSHLNSVSATWHAFGQTTNKKK